MLILAGRGPLIRRKTYGQLSPPEGYTLTFEDVFDYGSPGSPAAPDPAKWGVETFNHWAGSDFDAALATVDGSKLILRATGTSEANRLASGLRTSDTVHRNAFSGALGIENMWPSPGWLEVWAKMSPHTGVSNEIILWSDWWENPFNSDDGNLGEIAIEGRGFQPSLINIGTIAWTYPNYAPPESLHSVQSDEGAAIVPNDFHQWVVWWDATFVRVYVDGVLEHERDLTGDPAVWGRLRMLTLALYIASNTDPWAGEGGVVYPIDARMEVDSVRFYTTAGNVLLAETWPGANDASWPDTNWTHTVAVTGSGSATIQSNAGRLLASGAAYAAYSVRCALRYLGDFEITGQFTLASVGVEQYVDLFFREDGTYGFSAQWGYSLSIDSTGFRLNRYDNTTPTTLGSPIARTWNTSPWFIRLRADGSALKIRIWQGTEPGTWNIEQTDATHDFGGIYLRIVNGADGVTRSVLWGNFTVTRV